MTLAPLVDLALRDPALARAVDALGATGHDLVLPDGARPVALAALARHRTVLAVTATGREADDLAEALGDLLTPDSVAVYPSWETLPHERLSPRADSVGRRLAVLRRLAHPDERGPLRAVVAPVRSLLQPQAAELGEVAPVTLRPGDTADLTEVVERLVVLGYTRVDLVDKRGDVAVRGGLLDVFPPTEEHPVRVEFFGDEVEEVRSFAVADQRSLEPAPRGLQAPPCRELLLTDTVRGRARLLAEAHPELADVLDRLADGDPVEGMEAFAPVLADGMTLLVQELPAGTHVVVCDPERVRTRAGELVRTSREFLDASWSAAALGGAAPVDLEPAAYRDLSDVRETALAAGVPWWSAASFGDGDVLAATPARAYRGNLEAAVADMREWTRRGWRVVVVVDGQGSAQRVAELVGQAEVAARAVAGLGEAPPPFVVTATSGRLAAGFVAEPLELAVLTELDLAGQRGAGSARELGRMPVRRRNAVDPLALRTGDLVVHEQHGVGRYVEMVRRTVNGGEREYLIVEYARGDRLFVPTDSLEQVTRYVGGENPSLNRLGGSDWARTKGRARKAVREIAAELIRLYSARTATPGHAFGPDTPWQRELEDAFPYHETPDQLGAINEVKADMERPVPMDRIICGDVGYGKTEIAVRAAFKAVQDGKQVAVLVPTTLLVQQHMATFTERFSAFPVTVAAVSRFNSDAEQRAALDGLAAGRVDVVIGTHRLLSSETRFADLGLVVVDEEQRFGVEHKEYLKTLRANVDVLAMSATPIPRTLEMSLTGIREMSTILTPPEERHPVLTFVGPYDERQVAAAVRRELLREGQVFYVHNRVESIERAARRLRELVPEARIRVAHGQLPEDSLEQAMLAFWQREFDVLVCTTIVESGLDIANANTLVVERSDLMGLSQLHQLRGRVGRARERGYAYILYPSERPMTETAHDRLATIAQNNDLGAGMAVAMKDLEIRGAGNLLGGEQSGHIAGVGFDLYVRLVGEAVAAFRGDTTPEPAEMKVDLPIDAHLPHDYVNGERLRLAVYRELSEATEPPQVESVRAQLRDRFGPLPEPVENLLAVAAFRVHARGLGLTEVALQGSSVRFAPLPLRESQQLRLDRLYPRSLVKAATSTVLVPRPSSTGRIGGQPLRDRALLDWCVALLDAVAADSVAVAAGVAGGGPAPASATAGGGSVRDGLG